MAHRDVVVNFALLCGTIFLFFGGIETALRFTGIVKMKDYTPPMYERNENPLISYQLKPNISEYAFRNAVTTNSLGFRSPEPDLAKPMIAVIGDSITFGYGVADEETLSANLQKLLPAYDVQNAGVPGYNIRQEAALFRDAVAPLKPAALILVFYWNDFDQSISWLDEDHVLRSEQWMPQAKQCDPIERGILGLLPGKCFLDLQSALYRTVKGFANTRSALRERDTKRLEESAPNVDEENNVPAQDLQWYEQELSLLVPLAPPNRFFVIWPDASALHTEERKELSRIAQEHGFNVIDLYDHFGNTMETLTWDYIHPSPASLVQAAKIIHDSLGL